MFEWRAVYAAPARVFQRVDDLIRDPQSFVDRDWAFGDPLGERGPFDQLHRQRRRPLATLKTIYVSDVGMVQQGERLRLVLEPRHTIRIACEGGRQHLDRDIAAEVRIAGPIASPMPPAPSGPVITYTPNRVQHPSPSSD